MKGVRRAMRGEQSVHLWRAARSVGALYATDLLHIVHVSTADGMDPHLAAYYSGPPDPRAVTDTEIGQTVDVLPPAMAPPPQLSYEHSTDADTKSNSDSRRTRHRSSFSSSSFSSAAMPYHQWLGSAGDSDTWDTGFRRDVFDGLRELKHPPPTNQSSSHSPPAGLYDESWAPSAFLAVRVRAPATTFILLVPYRISEKFLIFFPRSKKRFYFFPFPLHGVVIQALARNGGLHDEP